MFSWGSGYPTRQHLTFTLKSLSHYAPEQGATVVAERWHLIVVDAELVWDVDSKPLLSSLWKGNRRMRAEMPYLLRKLLTGAPQIHSVTIPPEMGTSLLLSSSESPRPNNADWPRFLVNKTGQKCVVYKIVLHLGRLKEIWIFISSFIFKLCVSPYQFPHNYVHVLEPLNFRIKQAFYRLHTLTITTSSSKNSLYHEDRAEGITQRTWTHLRNSCQSDIQVVILFLHSSLCLSLDFGISVQRLCFYVTYNHFLDQVSSHILFSANH